MPDTANPVPHHLEAIHKARQVGNSTVITIPPEFLEAVGAKNGDRFRLLVGYDSLMEDKWAITLTPVNEAPTNSANSGS